MRAIVAVAFALLCAGCVSTNAAVLDSSVTYQKICPDGVQIFTSVERVPGPYQEVALLNSSGESGWTTERGMARSQQQKAAQLGANGIILGDTKEPNAGTKIIGSILGTGAERKGKAVAIFIPSDSVRVQRVCKITPRALATPYRDPEVVGTTPPTSMGTAPQAEVPQGEVPRAEAPRTEPARALIVAPAAATAIPVSAEASPAAPSAAPVVDRDALPEGARYVGDTRIRVYYPLDCARRHVVPPEVRVFFLSVDGAARDGFVASGDC